jgi:hypothetical protein
MRRGLRVQRYGVVVGEGVLLAAVRGVVRRVATERTGRVGRLVVVVVMVVKRRQRVLRLGAG